MTNQRFLSGVQPSGNLHLGNYFGAIRQHVQNQDDSFYFIADYHALTTISDDEALRRNSFDVAVAYLACGLDPSRATLFRQSDVPEVTELTWLLLTVTSMGLLERGVAYKEKVQQGVQPTAGLFTYPVLMAADILAYRSDVVPVGPDQVQHVEMTRDMAASFNHRHGQVFTLPEARIGVPVSVPGLDGQKMSKSRNNAIPLFSSGKDLQQRVMAIKTSSLGVEEPKDPSTCTVFRLYELVADDDARQEMEDRYRRGGLGFGDAKKALLERLEEHFAPANERRRELLGRPSDVEDVLREGGRRARTIAREVVDAARHAAGLGAGAVT